MGDGFARNRKICRLSEAARTSVVTPWGQASELRARKLTPGSGMPRAEVLRNQRDRLFAAMVAVASERGYQATTVAHLIEASGVSRSDFYKHFANKGDCLTQAAEALLEPTRRELEQVRDTGGDRPSEAVLLRFLELVAAQPAAARVCFVELQAAGREGEAAASRCFESLYEMVADLVAELPGRQRPPQLVRALLAGFCKVVHTRLYRHEEDELPGLAPELWTWMTSIEAPPSALETPRRQRQPAVARFPGYTPAERITRAVAAVVASKGFGGMNTGDIASEAAISLSTFYDHFTDKKDAVFAAIEMSGAQMMASAVPAARRADGWQDAARTLYDAMCAYFEAEPALAHLATVAAYEAGPQALSRRDRVIETLAEMLAPAAEENPAAPPVAAEAVAATVYAMIREQVRKAGPQNLLAAVPWATYITLAGYVGAERACEVANRGARRR
jgi:AcrR family transcriptional regulator